MRIQDWKVQEYKVLDEGWLWDGIKIDDDDQVLLVDYNKGEVITYNMKTRNKHVVIDMLDVLTSVDKAVTDQGVFYIVNEEWACTVRVYNDRWRLVRYIEGQGDRGNNSWTDSWMWSIAQTDEDESLNYPHTARVLPDNTIKLAIHMYVILDPRPCPRPCICEVTIHMYVISCVKRPLFHPRG